MNKQLTAQLHKIALEAAKQLEGKLPDLPSHPQGRIPIAHIYDVIKRVMGCPAKECGENRYDDIVKIIEFCRDNPMEHHVASILRESIDPEPVYERSTLERFLED